MTTVTALDAAQIGLMFVFAFIARDLLDIAVTLGTAVVIAARRQAAALDPMSNTGDNETDCATAQYRLVRN